MYVVVYINKDLAVGQREFKELGDALAFENMMLDKGYTTSIVN